MSIDNYQQNYSQTGFLAVTKRALDIVLSALGLLMLAPFFLVIWLLIKFDSPGPGFYRSPRVGRDGHSFGMYKFRTMVTEADVIGPAITYNADPRITRFGAWLRDRRLDELPQLFNVFRGEMSLVGPRPESAEYVRRYTQEQLRVLTIKPGVTGPMQIAFLDEESQLADADSLEQEYMTRILPAKLEKELQYLQRRSMLYDLNILLRTVWALLPGLWRAGERP